MNSEERNEYGVFGRQGRYLGPGSGASSDDMPREPRPWWFTEHMKLGLVQLFAAVGGLLSPIIILINVGSFRRRPMLPILALGLLGVGLYALVQTRGLREIETARDGPRFAAGIITLAGMLATSLFLLLLVVIMGILFLLVWPWVARHTWGLLTAAVRFLFTRRRRNGD